MKKIRLKYLEPFWVTLLLYIAVALICYGHTLEFGFHFDDYKDIVENPTIRDITNISSWWNYASSRPIAMLSFALNYHFHELDIRGYHIINILVHLINALLVFSITRFTLASPRLHGQTSSKYRYVFATLAGLLFLAHPVQTQAVTYIVQRMASLATLFYLSSLFAYILARQNECRGYQYGFFGLSFVLGILGMLTKQIVFTLPFSIILYEFTFNSTFSSLKKKIKITIGLVLLILLAIIPAVHKFDFSLISRTIVPQQGLQEPITAATYLLTQFRVLMTYLRLFVFPIDQQLDYHYALSSSLWEPAVILSLIALIALFVFSLIKFRHNRLFSFGIFWFFICLSVESSIIPLPNVIFEHRMYLPMIGLIWASLAVIYAYITTNHYRIIHIALVFVTFIFMGMTHQRNLVWQSESTLWNDEIKKAPKNPRAWASRSTVYFRANQFDKALADLNKAIELNPNYTVALQNRGIIHHRMKNYDAALADFNRILASNPTQSTVLNSRGLTYMELGQYKNAINDFSTALKQLPDDPKVLSTHGKASYFTGNDSIAIRDFSKILNKSPDDIEALTFRAKSYLRQNMLRSAANDLRNLCILQPTNAMNYYQLGNVYIQLKKYQQALQKLTEAIAINPDFVEAYNNRGNTHVLLGEYELAIDDFNNAIAVLPDYTNAFFNRSKVYYKLNDYLCALIDVRKSSELGYNVPNTYYSELLEKTGQKN